VPGRTQTLAAGLTEDVGVLVAESLRTDKARAALQRRAEGQQRVTVVQPVWVKRYSPWPPVLRPPPPHQTDARAPLRCWQERRLVDPADLQLRAGPAARISVNTTQPARVAELHAAAEALGLTVHPTPRAPSRPSHYSAPGFV